MQWKYEHLTTRFDREITWIYDQDFDSVKFQISSKAFNDLRAYLESDVVSNAGEDTVVAIPGVFSGSYSPGSRVEFHDKASTHVDSLRAPKHLVPEIQETYQYFRTIIRIALDLGFVDDESQSPGMLLDFMFAKNELRGDTIIWRFPSINANRQWTYFQNEVAISEFTEFDSSIFWMTFRDTLGVKLVSQNSYTSGEDYGKKWKQCKIEYEHIEGVFLPKRIGLYELNEVQSPGEYVGEITLYDFELYKSPH